MTISLSDAGKRFNYDWIFRHVNYTFRSGMKYAIVGPNGSGKSTLLQALAGYSWLSEGRLEATDPTGQSVSDDKLFTHVALAAPYLEVVEEMRLMEFWTFQSTFCPFLPGHTAESICERLGLSSSRDKQIRYFSSGMKQRVKLGQALFSAKPIVLLDEPCTNLDAAGMELYRELITELTAQKILVVCSNDEQEIRSCSERLDIRNFK